MPSFHRILVPTDFTDLSVHAAGYARDLATIHEAEVHILHVIVPPAVAGSTAFAPDAEPIPLQPAIDSLLESGRSGVADFMRTHFAGMRAHAETALGVAHRQICEYAQTHACDLIVIGSHARGMVHRIFLGSVSKAVLEHAPCPLLMVPLRSIESPPAS